MTAGTAAGDRSTWSRGVIGAAEDGVRSTYRTGKPFMKTPTAEPTPQKPVHSYDIGTWITVLIGIAALVKLGILISRHL